MFTKQCVGKGMLLRGARLHSTTYEAQVAARAAAMQFAAILLL